MKKKQSILPGAIGTGIGTFFAGLTIWHQSFGRALLTGLVGLGSYLLFMMIMKSRRK